MKTRLLGAIVGACLATSAFGQSQIPSGTVMGNSGAATSTIKADTLTNYLDRAFGATQDRMLYRGASGWAATAITSFGRSLVDDADAAAARTTLGVTIGTNVQAWDADLDCLAALSGAGILRRTGAGTCSSGTAVSNSELATASDGTIKSNISGSTATPSDNSISAVLDKLLGTTQGSVVYRGASSWAALAPGTNGQLFTSGGPSANPTWTTASGTGTVTSISANAGAKTSSGSAITTTGTVQLDGAYTGWAVNNCTLAVSASASALTIALKDNAGNDPSSSSPCLVNFRNVTGTTGSTTLVTVTAATSLVISSGSTLGITSSIAFRVWIVGFNDGGTFRLGAINCASDYRVYPLNEGIPTSSTAEGGAGAADNAGVIYTGTAVSSKAFRILGYAEWGTAGVTAGTWTTTNLSYVQPFGPGIKTPGSEVQSSFGFSNSATSTTSTTFQTTAVAATIVPSSPANRVAIQFSGAISATAPHTYGGGQVAVFRDSTQGSAPFTSPGAAGITPTSLDGNVGGIHFDTPNSTSSISYNVRVKSNNASQTVIYPYNGFYGHILVREIMG